MTIQEELARIEYLHTDIRIKDNYIILNKIYVVPGHRCQGIGSKGMNLLCKYADNNNLYLLLDPVLDYGATSITRLKKFYRRFNIFNNKGKTKRFDLPNFSLIRIPNDLNNN